MTVLARQNENESFIVSLLAFRSLWRVSVNFHRVCTKLLLVIVATVRVGSTSTTETTLRKLSKTH